MKRKLFVMGGGGFAMEPDNLLLDRYLLGLSDKHTPKVAFLGTASGDAEGYHAKYYSTYRTLPCLPTHLSLFKPHTRDIETYILSQDIIHVGGGNTRNLLCLWREWGLDQILRKAYDRGIVISGMSAGMICWFEEFTTDSLGGELAKMKGLGWITGSGVPHFDGEPDRAPSYESLLRTGRIKPGLALDDGTGALYEDELLKECVSSRPASRAIRYQMNGGEPVGEKLSVRLLQ